jgi:YD repeat-containing protein
MATAKYEYDPRNRLASYAPAGSPTQYFSYDALGNLIGRSTTAPGEQNQLYTHPTKPHALHSVAGGGTSSYDADGNVLYRGSNGLFQTFDSANRLLCVGSTQGGCNLASFAYDVDGNRILAGGVRATLSERGSAPNELARNRSSAGRGPLQGATMRGPSGTKSTLTPRVGSRTRAGSARAAPGFIATQPRCASTAESPRPARSRVPPSPSGVRAR